MRQRNSIKLYKKIKKENGFTLIEVLVGMGIFISIMVMTVQIYVNVLRLQAEAENFSILQAQLSNAITVIKNSAQQADCAYIAPSDYLNPVGFPFDPCTTPVGGNLVQCPSLNPTGNNNSQSIQYYKKNVDNSVTYWMFEYDNTSNPYGVIKYNTGYIDLNGVNHQYFTSPQILIGGPISPVNRINMLWDGSAGFTGDSTVLVTTAFDIVCPPNQGLDKPYSTFQISGRVESIDNTTKYSPLTLFGSADLENSLL